jgi:acetyl esterase/lipase
MLRKNFTVLLFTSVVALIGIQGLALADDEVGPEPIALWPEGAPGAKGTDATDIPQIRIYPAEAGKATGACVVVLPGGGYTHLATDHEGQQVARWLNSIGVTAAVVTYRLGPKYHYPAQLQDAQRGIRYVREHATELKIDPQRVGIMGFSAGGHLASTVATHFDPGESASQDPVARQSSRPDFCILGYPVISLKSSFTHSGSKKNLLGENPDPALVEKLSNETQVTKETPPTFIFHTYEDKGVPVENALVYFAALRQHQVPAEMHIYQMGPHGVGLAPKNPVLSTWKERLADWLKINGFLSSSKRAAVSGTIRVHGQPLRWGSIIFTPRSDPNAPSAFAMVSSGKFSTDGSNGPVLGLNDLTICSLGAVEVFPTVADVQVIADAHTGLVLDVKEKNNALALELP